MEQQRVYGFYTDDTVDIQNLSTGLCLAIGHASTVKGAAVIQCPVVARKSSGGSSRAVADADA